ncbi:MAG: hypothetical protein O2930_01505 [Acidobacteria bacterium]|nr:hypothetical protein [Acidobacteriota bacterium]
MNGTPTGGASSSVRIGPATGPTWISNTLSDSIRRAAFCGSAVISSASDIRSPVGRSRGAHFLNRQTPFNGFPISLERHVALRCGSTALPLTALDATFIDAEVELDHSRPTDGGAAST